MQLLRDLRYREGAGGCNGIKLLVNATEDFTGEFRKTVNTQAQWKMNDSPSSDDATLHDSSGYARNFTINGWSGTIASTRDGKLGKYFRFNTVNPATEKHILEQRIRAIFLQH